MRNKKPMTPRDGMFLIILGLAILGGVFWVHTRQQAFASIAKTTTGTVIELRRGSGKNSSYYPIVEFLTRKEKVYTFESAMASNPPAYKVGDQVEILYNPERPEEAVITADNSITTNPAMWLMCGMGLVLIGVGAYPSVKAYRQRHKQAYA
jgi:hypothetical protein